GEVLLPLLLAMEGSGHAEDRLAVLDTGDTPGCEALPVAEPIHEVHDGRGHVTREDEVPMKRMRLARFIHGPPGGHERLRQHLSPEDATGPDLPIVAAVDVVFDRFEIEQVEQ